MDDPIRRTAVIVATHISLLEPLVEQGGFEVVGAADTVMNGEHLAQLLPPDVIVVENDLPGSPGAHAIGSLRARSPQSRIVLVVNEYRPEELGFTLGTTVVVSLDELMSLPARLRDLESVIGLRAPTYDGFERRVGGSRRARLDWTKVGWERRRGGRRASDRVAAKAAETV